jgi:hypothetical protein
MVVLVADQKIIRIEINDTMRWYPSEPSIILQGNWFHTIHQ